MNSLTQTKIREPREDEFGFIVDIVVAEVPKLPNYVGIKVDADRVMGFLRLCKQMPHMYMMRMLVDANDKIIGGVSGYCVKQLLSNDLMTNDVLLFILPEHRSLHNVVKLMLAYRDWGIAQGATLIGATVTGGYRSEQVGQLLQRFGGYVPVGTIYYYRQ